MRDIKTIKISIDLAQDLSAMHGLDISKEITSMVESECKYNAIIVSKEEYDHYTNARIISPNDFSQKRKAIASKIIGITQDNDTIDVVDTLGNPLGSCKSVDEFTEKYFVDLL